MLTNTYHWCTSEINWFQQDVNFLVRLNWQTTCSNVLWHAVKPSKYCILCNLLRILYRWIIENSKNKLKTLIRVVLVSWNEKRTLAGWMKCFVLFYKSILDLSKQQNLNEFCLPSGAFCCTFTKSAPHCGRTQLKVIQGDIRSNKVIQDYTQWKYWNA